MFFNKDSSFLGAGIGLSVPVLFFNIQDFILPLIIGVDFAVQSMQLFALIFNLLFFRYYLINLNYEKTAKGIFFVTFIYAIIWIYIHQDNI